MHIYEVAKMIFVRLFLLTLLTVSGLTGSELGDVVAKLKEPKIETAKEVLNELDRMIVGGDARTVTLAKKVHRSIKRIFTKEHKMLEGKKEADGGEANAKQFEKNGRQWLKPNIHGRINKLAASEAFHDAKVLRKKSFWAQEELSKEWLEEVKDFEKMLGDLRFSKEEKALLSLAELLAAIVERTPWVNRPPLTYDRARIQFLREHVVGKEQWLTLASHASDAGNLELAYDFYRLAGSHLGRFRMGAKMAGRLAEEGYPGSAINLWERLGEEDRAAELAKANPVLTAASYQVLGVAALERHTAPACVRVLTPGGHQTGFFFRQGGFLVTCKLGLLDKDGDPHPLTVVLEDGRKFPAKVLGFSSGHDVAALKIAYKGHEILPVGDRADLKPGLDVILFGFTESAQNIPSAASGTVMVAMDEWNRQPTSRLALDGSQGQRGAPIVDQRGRVLGIFLASKTGTARSLEAGAIQHFIKEL